MKIHIPALKEQVSNQRTALLAYKADGFISEEQYETLSNMLVTLESFHELAWKKRKQARFNVYTERYDL